MKSTLLNMTAVLFAVTLVASAGVGAVHLITEEPIARARAAAEVEALERVLPPFEHTVSQELVIGDLPVTVYTATDGEGRIAGYAVKSETRRGFGGVIRMMTGFGPDGRVLNVNVLEQTETPGLGTAMAEEDNVLLRCVQGRRPAEMQLVDGAVAVRKDGGDVDALTAATISSRAWCDALNRAWRAYEVVANGADAATFAGGTDASSGATSTSSAGGAAETDAASGATSQADASDASSGATSTSCAGGAAGTDAASGATSQAAASDASSGATSTSCGAAGTDAASGATSQADTAKHGRTPRCERSGPTKRRAPRTPRQGSAPCEEDTADHSAANEATR